ncbi:oxidoreductase [Croceicoccus pelagius]|uniref:Short-chain dehydrogenase n=1 Tax=Croceicoccus pelagius TaxID=1703341 RepID=A0A916Y5U3_9SPHN|nr:oxidoreductase [Croceicoccus pelagius]GGD31190.1 short-chain dehydrogenase [Croceicoccus pelagius]
MPGFTAAYVPDLSGRTYVVTGANTGLGFEAARVLAARGGEVVLACRSEDKAREAMARISRETPHAKLDFAELDLGDLDAVRRSAESLSQRERLDVLVNNAGVMIPPLSHTAQGFELQFGVNHLGTFALTSLLLPKLAEGKGPRVVVTSSIAHRSGQAVWSDPKAEEHYARSQRYSDSKLANALFFVELARRLSASGSPVISVGCHPGVASTDLGRHVGIANLAMKFVGKVLNTAEQGAWPTLQAATDPEVVNGDYYGPRGLREMSGPSGPAFLTRLARDPGAGEWLWQRSVELTGVDPGLLPV